MKKFLIPALLLTLLGAQPLQDAPKKPNILFILVDDLGYRDLGFMGSEFYETPNIDRLAASGMVFTRGYAACSVCSPSRASLLTGQYPTRHGITNYIGARSEEDWRNQKRHTPLLPPKYQRFLPHELTTLPEMLKEAGYTTFFAGKWHLGGEKEQSLPTDHGFDINKGGFHAGGPYTGGFFSPFNNPFLMDYPEEKGIHLSTKLAKETSSFIASNEDQPFLAYLSFYAVHAPIQTTHEKWGKYRDKAESMGIEEHGFAMERILPIRRFQDNPVYAGLVEHVDDAVGMVMDQLEKSGLMDNTIVVFTSDNGGVSSGDNFSTSLHPLRGGKGYQWEGGIRVPLIIRVPWMNLDGKQTDIPISGIDLFPTLAELTGQPIPLGNQVDGKSLVSALKDVDEPNRDLYWHYPHYGNQGGEPNSTIMNGKYKLIYYWESGISELYDLDVTPLERKNLAADLPGISEEMKERLVEHLNTTGTLLPSIDPLFNQDSLNGKLKYYQTELKEKLEKERLQMLRKDWKPNANWWGSQY